MTRPLRKIRLLTASTLGIADGDGLGPFSFQWQASLDGISWSPIAGATAATFAPGDAHVGRQLRVVVSYTDLGQDESVTSLATAAVLNINDAPTEAPTINDTTPAEDQTLTASTAGDRRRRWPWRLQLPVAGVARRHQLEPHCGRQPPPLPPATRTWASSCGWW